MSDPHQFLPVSSSGVNSQDISNARRVEFVFEEIGFQRRGFFRFQAIVERPSWHGDRRGETDGFRKILGISQREFLTVKIADGRMSFHDNSRFVPVDTTHERALNGGDQAILKLVGVFAKIPHVAISILGEPIERIFRQPAVHSDRIVDFDAGDAEDHLGMVRHGELIVFKTLGGMTLIDEGRARP